MVQEFLQFQTNNHFFRSHLFNLFYYYVYLEKLPCRSHTQISSIRKILKIQQFLHPVYCLTISTGTEDEYILLNPNRGTGPAKGYHIHFRLGRFDISEHSRKKSFCTHQHLKCCFGQVQGVGSEDFSQRLSSTMNFSEQYLN